MGVVDDVRKLLQDLVTPEMRALANEVKNQGEKIDGLRQDTGEKIENLRKEIGNLRAETGEKIDSFRAEMNRRFDYIESSFRLDERVSLLEAERKKPRRQPRQ